VAVVGAVVGWQVPSGSSREAAMCRKICEATACATIADLILFVAPCLTRGWADLLPVPRRTAAPSAAAAEEKPSPVSSTGRRWRRLTASHPIADVNGRLERTGVFGKAAHLRRCPSLRHSPPNSRSHNPQTRDDPRQARQGLRRNRNTQGLSGAGAPHRRRTFGVRAIERAVGGGDGHRLAQERQPDGDTVKIVDLKLYDTETGLCFSTFFGGGLPVRWTNRLH